MKKIVQLICIGLIVFITSCSTSSSENEVNQLALLDMMGLIGHSTLSVTATYTGTAAEVGATGKIFVYLYDSMGLTTRDPKPKYTGSTAAAVTIGTPATVNITGIRDGEYYMLVFYDFHSGDKYDNQTDRYVLYNDTAYTSAAQKFMISGSKVITGITFGDTNQLAASSAYMTTATYTLTVNATYTGVESTDADATKKMYVYLYGSLGSDIQNPLYTGSSSGTVSSGASEAVTVSSVAPGKYYALVFYDSSHGTSVGSSGDPYILFTNTSYPGNATKFVMTGDLTLTPSISFTDANVLGSNGAYKTPSSTYTLTVSAAYTGTRPAEDRSMYVYLYSLLGTGTRNTYFPIYTGASSAVSSTDPYTITIDNVIPGDYYVLVFYNYNYNVTNSYYDNQNDRYRLYDNAVPAGTRCRSEADPYTVSGASSITGISIDNTYYLRASATYETSACP